MRKILILLIIITSSVEIYASSKCPLKGTLAPELKEYFTTLDTTLSNISSVASATQCKKTQIGLPENGLTGDVTRTARSLIATVNSVWSFESFTDSFRFWSDNLLTSGTPRVTEQAKEALESARRKIMGQYDKIRSTCTEGNIISEGKTGISALDGSDVTSALNQILANHIRIERIFYKATLDDPRGPTEENLIAGLTPEGFETKLRKSYASTATAQCQSASGTLEAIGERMKKIFSRATKIDTTQNSWAESWAILNGSAGKMKIEALERKLLLTEMQRQGMSTAGTTIILNNLNRYNTTGNRFGAGIGPSSFVTGLDNVERITKRIYEPFQETVARSPNTDALMKNLRNLEYRRDTIQPDLDTLYMQNRDMLMANDGLSIDQKTLTDLIALHIELMNINKTLVTDWIPKAESLCRSELTGYGICKYR